MLNPLTISKLQQSVRQESYETYKIYSENINKQNQQFMTIRGLFKFQNLTQFQLKKLNLGQKLLRDSKQEQCLWLFSKEAHENLAIAMNRIGGKSNSGEGGEDPARFKVNSNGDSKIAQ